MLKAIIGTKIDQSQVFDDKGNRISVSRINAGPCYVVTLKNKDIDGYSAVTLGCGTKRTNLINKPELGVLKKAGLDQNPPRFLREIKLDESDDAEGKLTPGMAVNLQDVLKTGDIVEVTGVSKGHGFAGVVKRHHFKGGPRTHGQSDRERAPGSIGQTTTPGRVYKGKRMAGRMGQDTVTVKNLKVVSVDQEKRILTLSGLVPGKRNSLLIISKIGS